MDRSLMRTDVLDVAASLFAANGYKATNLNLVAARLGVTRQALYYHFTSKNAVLATLSDDLVTVLEDALAGSGPDFESMLRAHVEAVAEHTDLAAIALREGPELDKALSDETRERWAAYHAHFADAYTDDGVPGVPIVDLVAAYLTAATAVLVQQVQAGTLPSVAVQIACAVVTGLTSDLRVLETIAA